MSRWLLILALVPTACAAGGAALADDMPADLAEVVSTTLEGLEEALPSHLDCLDGLVVAHAWELEERAEYRPETQTVVLRVPGTAPNLEFSLVHEIAHHLEFACPSQVELRPAFLLAKTSPRRAHGSKATPGRRAHRRYSLPRWPST